MKSTGSLLGTTTTQDLVLLGVLGLAGYVIYEVVSATKKVAKPITDAAAAVAQMGDQASEVFDTTPDATNQTWASWYDPTQRSVLFYWLTFPDGHHHAVWGSDVQPDGSFVTDNLTYRIGVDKAGGLRAYVMPADTDWGLTSTGGWS